MVSRGVARAALLIALVAAIPAGAGAAAPDPAHLEELVARARAEKLADDPGWLRLGHYQRTLTGGWKSQAEGKAFFRAPAGKTDPAAELEATLRGFFDDTPKRDELDDAQCRFPARFAFLRRRLEIDLSRLPQRRCPWLVDFLARTRPRGVTVVFSSYYLNNPASAFGHTLLRLDKEPEARSGKHFELLDYGANYSATVDTKNPFVYLAKGLAGGFRGEFQHYAYYYKVREYADFESRDLWEYDLALEPDEVALLGAHLWEVGGTWFRYWYLDENCSYHVLSALEAAAPRLELLSHVGRFVVLPSDTLQALFANPGLVRAVHYRPSIRTQFEARAQGLDADERRGVEALAHDPAAPLPASLGEAERAATLDAALDRFDLRNAKGILLGSDAEAGRRRQVLLERRAAEPGVSPPLVVPTPEDRRPEAGHGSSRAGAGGGWSSDRGGFALVDARLALHDLGDPSDGYPAYAQIEFLPARLRVYADGTKLQLDDLSLLKIVSLNPVSSFDLVPSWRLRVGATTVRDSACNGCLAGVGELGAGLDAAAGPLDVAALADTELVGAPALSGIDGAGVRLGVGPSALLRVRAGTHAALLLDARWRWLPFASPESTYALSAQLRIHATKNVSLSLEARRMPLEDALSAGVLGYF